MALSLAGKTILVTGGSRGIGLAVAKRAAQSGANIVIVAKTTEPHPKLPGTIYTAVCKQLFHFNLLPTSHVYVTSSYIVLSFLLFIFVYLLILSQRRRNVLRQVVKHWPYKSTS